ncbi:probable iron (III) ABC transporter, periplasmic-binding protein [Desulfotalea psychrophila LSv54]|uniref:Probable iron (III) ABC transporter, periplasmic-binding protein n=2 Tax=Desulfotalea psychrophila TaxID=84980 RepID=Q6AIX1_DESPS|nr:probable iron (III) ABC transporter, periplasmic-binding protein [Desulfotalea psychrophila LSv54]
MLCFSREDSMKKIFFLVLCLLPFTTSAMASTVTVTDQVGRRVTIPQPVKRVVTTFLPATVFALCVGLEDTLVAATSKDMSLSIYKALVHKKDVPLLVGSRSSGLNLETIISLHPDLVIMYGQKDGVRLANRLTALGIPTIVISPETMADMQETLQLIGRASGRDEQSTWVVAAMTHIQSILTERLAGLARPEVYYTINPLLRTSSGNMLQDEIIELAGGHNVSHDTRGFFISITREQLIAWNPEAILCSDRLTDKGMARLQSPQFSSLAAVKNEQVFRFPRDTYWDFPSPLSMAGVLWLAHRLHPEAFVGIDVQAEIDAYYDIVFGEGFSAGHPHVVGRGSR